jgi:hypothetical protein
LTLEQIDILDFMMEDWINDKNTTNINRR